MSYEPKDVRIDLPRLGDESAALAESERAQLTEYKAQNARLESVITGLKQQVKALERDQNESLEHIRTVCRQRDEARERCMRDDAGVTIHACPGPGEALMPCCERPPFEVLADRMTCNPALVNCDRERLRSRLADLERWRELAGPVVELVREIQAEPNYLIQERMARDVIEVPLPPALPEPPKVTP